MSAQQGSREVAAVQERLREFGLYGGRLDGVVGPATRAAATAWAVTGREGTLDPRSGVHIYGGMWNGAEVQGLHRRLQIVAERHIRLVRGLMEASIISGHRTYAQQAELYAQGRTRPGRIVTNARPGYSNHNFALAYDIGIFWEGRYLESSGLYTVAGEIGKALGLVWGGDWVRMVDPPHFEFPHGLSLAQLRARVAAGQDVLG